MVDHRNDTMSDGGAEPRDGTRRRELFVGATIIVALWLVYAALVVPTWSNAYLDFGDGNYIYVASRVADGAQLYGEILSPQPPIHTVIGSAALKLGDLMLGRDLWGIRAYSLLLKLATGLLLLLVLGRLQPPEAMLAKSGRFAKLALGAGFLLLPTSFWWARGYQTHPTVVALVLSGYLLVASADDRWWSPRAMAGGALLGLAQMTSMTAAPYNLLLGLWVLIRRPRLAPCIAGGAAAVGGALAGFYEVRTGAFFDNVVRNQVGSFPREEITGEPLWRYVVRKWVTQGGKVVEREWVMLAAGGAGVVAALVSAWRRRDRGAEMLAMLGIAWLGSIVFVAKGATADYIFSLGEPWLAVGIGVMAAAFVAHRNDTTGSHYPTPYRRGLVLFTGVALLTTLVSAGRDLYVGELYWLTQVAVFTLLAAVGAVIGYDRAIGRTTGGSATRRVSRTSVAGATIVTAMLVAGLFQIVLFDGRVLAGTEDELSAEQVERIIGVIERTTQPGDAILSPPHYAYISGRRVAGEYAEIFLWTIKYWNERKLPEFQGQHGPGIEKVEELAGLIERREIPLIILDLAQTGRIPEIAAAIDAHYCPLFIEQSMTMNTPLQFYVPRVGDRCDDQLLGQGPLVRFER